VKNITFYYGKQIEIRKHQTKEVDPGAAGDHQTVWGGHRHELVDDDALRVQRKVGGSHF
jgi:hypothetical protein